eukprot:gb/GECG01004750.1/.p1 GENE.gb/GECG01004750.1/~~gb/GECG01004750.1/.p1  ORF type:complete len:2138 (+),score=269.53 gb/GECG01004750.1/:1-6414(+)
MSSGGKSSSREKSRDGETDRKFSTESFGLEQQPQNNLVPAERYKRCLLRIPRMKIEGGDLRKLNQYQKRVLESSQSLGVLTETDQREYLQRPCQPLFSPQRASDSSEKHENHRLKLPRKNSGQHASQSTFSKTPFPLVSYINQGDASYYTVENLVYRHRLRYTENVQKWLQAWWRIAKTRLTSSMSGVIKQTYVRAMSVLHLVLSGVSESLNDVKEENESVDYSVRVSERRFGEAVALSELDWERDIRLQGISSAEFLNRDTWMDSLFELADIWCDSAGEKEYCQFLAFCLCHYMIAVEAKTPGEIDAQLNRTVAATDEESKDFSKIGSVSSIARMLEKPQLSLKPEIIPFVGIHWRNIDLPDDVSGFLNSRSKGAQSLLQKVSENFRLYSRDYYADSHRYTNVGADSFSGANSSNPTDLQAQDGPQNRSVLRRNSTARVRSSWKGKSPLQSVDSVTGRWKVAESLRAGGLSNSVVSAMNDTQTVKDFMQLGKWTQDKDGRLYNKSLDDELRLVIEEFRRRQRLRNAKVRYLKSNERLFYRRNARQEARKLRKTKTESGKELSKSIRESTPGAHGEDSEASSLSKRTVSTDVVGDRERKGLNMYWENRIDVRDWELLGVRPVKIVNGSEMPAQETATSSERSALIGSDAREWQWVAEMPADHRFNPVHKEKNDPRVVRSQDMQRIGIFPDQLSAALAYDVAVRFRRIQCGLGLDPYYVSNSRIQEDDIESVKERMRENKASRLQGSTNIRGGSSSISTKKQASGRGSPATSYASSEDSTESSDEEHDRSAPQHSLYTNFSIVGQLLEPPDHLRTPRRYWPASLQPISRRFWQQLETYLGQGPRWKGTATGQKCQTTRYSAVLRACRLHRTGLWCVVARNEFTTDTSIDFYLELKPSRKIIPQRWRHDSSYFRKRRIKCRTLNEWLAWQRRYHRALVTEVIQWHQPLSEDGGKSDSTKEDFSIRRIACEGFGKQDGDTLTRLKGRAFVKKAGELSNSLGKSPEEILKAEAGWAENDANCRHRTLLDSSMVFASLQAYGAFSGSDAEEAPQNNAMRGEKQYEKHRNLSYSAFFLVQSSGVPARLAVATVPTSAVELSSTADYTWPCMTEQEEDSAFVGTLRDLNHLYRQRTKEEPKDAREDSELDWHKGNDEVVDHFADGTPSAGETGSGLRPASNSSGSVSQVDKIPKATMKTVVSRTPRERDTTPSTMPSPESQCRSSPDQEEGVSAMQGLPAGRESSATEKNTEDDNEAFSSEAYSFSGSDDGGNLSNRPEEAWENQQALMGMQLEVDQELATEDSGQQSDFAAEQDLHRDRSDFHPSPSSENNSGAKASDFDTDSHASPSSESKPAAKPSDFGTDSHASPSENVPAAKASDVGTNFHASPSPENKPAASDFDTDMVSGASATPRLTVEIVTREDAGSGVANEEAGSPPTTLSIAAPPRQTIHVPSLSPSEKTRSPFSGTCFGQTAWFEHTSPLEDENLKENTSFRSSKSGDSMASEGAAEAFAEGPADVLEDFGHGDTVHIEESDTRCAISLAYYPPVEQRPQVDSRSMLSSAETSLTVNASEPENSLYGAESTLTTEHSASTSLAQSRYQRDGRSPNTYECETSVAAAMRNRSRRSRHEIQSARDGIRGSGEAFPKAQKLIGQRHEPSIGTIIDAAGTKRTYERQYQVYPSLEGFHTNRHSCTSGVSVSQVDLGDEIEPVSNERYVKTSNFIGNALAFSHSRLPRKTTDRVPPEEIQRNVNTGVASENRGSPKITYLPENLKGLWAPRSPKRPSLSAGEALCETDIGRDRTPFWSRKEIGAEDAGNHIKDMDDSEKGVPRHDSRISYRSGLQYTQNSPQAGTRVSTTYANASYTDNESHLRPIPPDTKNNFLRGTTLQRRGQKPKAYFPGAHHFQTRSKTSGGRHEALTESNQQKSSLLFSRDIDVDTQLCSTSRIASAALPRGRANTAASSVSASYGSWNEFDCKSAKAADASQPNSEQFEGASYGQLMERGSPHSHEPCSGIDDLNRVEQVSRRTFESEVSCRLKISASVLRESKDALSPKQVGNRSSILEDPTSVRSLEVESSTQLRNSEGSVRASSEAVSQSTADETVYKILQRKSTPSPRRLKKPASKKRVATSAVSRGSRARLVRSAR